MELTSKELLVDLYHAAIDAVDGRHCVLRWCQQYPQEQFSHVFAIGKAATAMLQGFIDSGRQFESALVITKESRVPRKLLRDERIEFVFSSHPVPDQASLDAGEKLISQIGRAPQDASLLFLISGGTSSLVESCRAGADLELLQQVNRHLLASGKSIHQMNAWRKQFSAIKGGGLLEVIGERAVTQLMISDVAGDDPAVIGSGLLMPSDVKLDEDETLLALKATVADEIDEPRASTVTTNIIATLDHAKAAAHEAALNHGVNSICHQEFVEGDALERGRQIAEQLLHAEAGVHVFGGETTVELPSNPGAGGRNQAMALAMSEVIEAQDICVLCAGTDGIDGNTPCAGAMVTGDTALTARKMGFDIQAELEAANSGTVLMATGDLFKPGATSTNVMDVIIAYKRS